MNIFTKQSQFELFPSSAASPASSGKNYLHAAQVVLSLENIIVLCIMLVIASVLFFSLGVERGRKTNQPVKRIVKEAVKDPLPAVSTAHRAVVQAKENNKAKPRFTIQVASFREQSYAQKEAVELKRKGFESSIVSNGKLFVVCVGRFSLPDEAKKTINKLKSDYHDCLVRRL